MSTRLIRSLAASGKAVFLLCAMVWFSSLVRPLRAQTAEPGTSDWVQHFIGVVNARGKDCHIPEKTSRLVGLPHQAFPDREIDIWRPEIRALAVVVVDGEISLLVSHGSANDIWMFRVSESGSIERAIWVSPHQVHHMTDDQAADQLNVEETWWSDWAGKKR